VEDAVHAHQRPKLERYDDTLFTVFKTIHYVEPPGGPEDPWPELRKRAFMTASHVRRPRGPILRGR
ncbi:hypothetical protein AB0B51_38395, partial [Streptomyces griseus]|uniref:hypothetical protein n=1 Tax=Streptomyces griseus TaxID=1911 RepID=UPI0033C646D5